MQYMFSVFSNHITQNRGLNMPNIEIHGFARETMVYGTHINADAQGLRCKIFEAFADEPFLSDIVVTVVASDVCDPFGAQQPFLRVYSTPGPDVDRVMQILDEQFDMDVEGPIEINFRPKKSVRNSQPA